MQIVIGLQIGNQSNGVGGDPTVGVKLQIFVQPAGAIAGVVFGTQPVVRCLTSGNTLDTSFTGSITLTKISGPGSMNGTQTIVAVAGVATFTNLSIDTAGDCVLQATSSGKTSADTDEFTVAPAYAVDLILMPTGTNDALVTVASLAAGEIGNTTGWSAFSLSRTPMQHTFVRSAEEVRRNNLVVAGISYDGTGYKTIESDLTLALSNGSTPLYEKVNITANGTQSSTYTFLVKFGVTTGTNDVNFDIFEANFGSAGRLQISARGNGQFFAYAHTDFGNGSPHEITNTDWYSCTLRANYADQKVEILIVNNSTGEVIGTSEVPLTVTTQGLLLLDDSYLLTTDCGGGKITRGLFGVDFTNAAFPLEDVTVPIPTSLAVNQPSSGAAHLTWDSVTQRIKIERRVNGGAWSVIEASYDGWTETVSNEYTDSGLTDGSTYDYRIYGLVGDSLESAASSVASITITNSADLVAHITAHGASDISTGTVDTSGANLLVALVTWYDQAGTDNGTISDTIGGVASGNTWHPLTKQNSAGNQSSRIYYCENANVGANHVFSYTGLSPGVAFASMCVAAFSNISAASSFDQENGSNAGFVSTIATGSITPSQANSLVIAGLGFNDISGATPSVNSSLVITDTVAFNGGGNFGSSMAWKILSAATPTNPTWDVTNSSNSLSAVIANFKY